MNKEFIHTEQELLDFIVVADCVWLVGIYEAIFLGFGA